MTGIRNSMKMTPRRGSRMISKAERRLGEASSGLYGARPRIHSPKRTPQNISISSCLFRSTLASILVLFLLLFLSPCMTSASRTVYIHTSNRLFVASVPKDYFQPTTFVFGDLLYVKRSYRKRNAWLVRKKYIYYYYSSNNRSYYFLRKICIYILHCFYIYRKLFLVHLLCFKYLEQICVINPLREIANIYLPALKCTLRIIAVLGEENPLVSYL